MAFLFLFFTIALSLCVVGLIVIALAAILGRVRDAWEIEKTGTRAASGGLLISLTYSGPQSSSASRFTAGAFGFLTCTQCGERPERYSEPIRFETMPSQPSLQACSKTMSPSPS
jgi:hypothetical protein